jgi:C-terminal processing protease CtpA/Prc
MNELMFLAGEGDLMVRDAATGELVPASQLESELKLAEQKQKNQSRSDASTGVCWWQDPKSKVVFVLRIMKDSPAQLTRLQSGDALIKVICSKKKFNCPQS